MQHTATCGWDGGGVHVTHTGWDCMVYQSRLEGCHKSNTGLVYQPVTRTACNKLRSLDCRRTGKPSAALQSSKKTSSSQHGHLGAPPFLFTSSTVSWQTLMAAHSDWERRSAAAIDVLSHTHADYRSDCAPGTTPHCSLVNDTDCCVIVLHGIITCSSVQMLTMTARGRTSYSYGTG